MIGLLQKIFREVRLQTLFLSLGLCAVTALLTFILPRAVEGISDTFARMPFVRTILQGLLGTAIGDTMSIEIMQTLLWVHPVVLTLVMAHAIVYCTRVPAGEVDRGTVDILFTLPVSRWTIYHAETIGWLCSGLFLFLVGFSGHFITRSEMPQDTRPEFSEILLILSNFYCVYFAVGAIVFLISTWSDRRGRAVAGAFAFFLMSFLLNFLAQFWDLAERLSFLSVLSYYRPAEIMQDSQATHQNMLILLAIGVVAWTAGGLILSRRNITTV